MSTVWILTNSQWNFMTALTSQYIISFIISFDTVDLIWVSMVVKLSAVRCLSDPVKNKTIFTLCINYLPCFISNKRLKMILTSQAGLTIILFCYRTWPSRKVAQDKNIPTNNSRHGHIIYPRYRYQGQDLCCEVWSSWETGR